MFFYGNIYIILNKNEVSNQNHISAQRACPMMLHPNWKTKRMKIMLTYGRCLTVSHNWRPTYAAVISLLSPWLFLSWRLSNHALLPKQSHEGCLCLIFLDVFHFSFFLFFLYIYFLLNYLLIFHLNITSKMYYLELRF